MSLKQKISISLSFILIGIQFIQPKLNVNNTPQLNDITTTTLIPQDILISLHKACYDCHSNNSTYPWYSYIQPIGWYIKNHINEGKDELNFSTFATLSIRQQIKKYSEIAREVTENEMPLKSFTLMHKNAILTKEETKRLINWAGQMSTQIERDSIFSKNIIY